MTELIDISTLVLVVIGSLLGVWLAKKIEGKPHKNKFNKDE